MTRNALAIWGSLIVSILAGIPTAMALPHYTYTQEEVAAGFQSAVPLAADPAGDVYIIDNHGDTLYKETFANNAYTQSTPTTGAVAPSAIVCDAAGNLYIADSSSGKVFKETVANGAFTESTVLTGLSDPSGLAIDAAGDLYVVVYNSGPGTFSILKETLANGAYTQITVPTGLNSNDPFVAIAVDGSGTLYLTDYQSNRVLKETLVGGAYVESTIGSGIGGPNAVAVDANGTVYISDSNHFRILVEQLQGGSYAQSVYSGYDNGGVQALLADTHGDLYYSLGSSVYFSAVNPLAEAAFTSFASAAVASTSTTQTVTFTFDVGGTLATTPPYTVTTQGKSSLDFNASTTQAAGACASGATYAMGATCTVAVSFSPTLVGPRYGAVVLYGVTGRTLGTAYLQGGGLAAQVSFSPGTFLSSQGGTNFVVGVDGVGDLASPFGLENEQTRAPIQTPGYGFSPTFDGAGNILFSNNLVINVSNNGSFTGGVQELTFDPYAPNQSATNAYALGGYNFSYPAYQAFALYESVGGSAVDGMGNIAFTDSDNNLVYLEAFSGGGYDESTIGSGFNNPTAIAFDASGALFIVDAGTGRIIKETPSSGTYTQSVIATGLTNASAIAVDALGNVYIPQATTTVKLINSNGTYTASSIATTSDPANNQVEVAVDPRGNYFIGRSSVTNAGLYELDVSDAPTLQFDSTAVGSTSADSPQTVTIVNNGTQALTFAAPGGTAPITAGFTLNASSSCPLLPGTTHSLTLAAGASCTLSVSFTPNVSGYITGTLTVTNNALNAPGSTQVIKLIGTGTGSGTGTGTPPATPTLALTPSSVDYGSVTVGTPASETLTLTNNGTVAANIASTALPNAVFTLASSTCGTSLSVGASCAYIVSFAPTAAGAQTTTFSVTDDAGTQSSALMGTGVAASTGTGGTTPTADFGVAATPAIQSVSAGDSTSYAINVSSVIGSFDTPVTLSASGLPAGATVSFSPATVTPNSAGGSVTMTVHTAALTATADRPSTLGVVLAAPMLGLFICVPVGRRRRQWHRLGGVVMLIAALSGCGGGYALPESAATSQTYTITVTGTAGSVVHSTTVQLTVTSATASQT